MRHLHLELNTPLASQVVGEMAPRQTGQRGQPETFTLYVRPVFQAGDRGFDQVLVTLPPGVEVALVEATIGSEIDLAAGRGQDGVLLPPGLYLCRVGLEVDAEGETPTIVKVVASVY